MSTSVVGLGAGGHAKVVIEILQQDDNLIIKGLLDPNYILEGTKMMGVPILGSDSLLAELKHSGVSHFFVGVGGIGDNSTRIRLYKFGLGHGLIPIKVMHQAASVSATCFIGEGVAIMALAAINPGARIGDNVIVNTGAIIEHDCLVGNHVHIATGARLCGSVHVGDGAHIGAGSTIRQNVHVGQDVLVGAGAVVVKDLPAKTIAAGVPARPLRRE